MSETINIDIEVLGKKDTRSGFGEGLLEIGRKNKDVVALCADLTGSLKMNAFESEFPERFFQIGIAEANMMGIAAGMTIGGKIPFTGTFANFSTGRVYDQIRQSIAYSQKNLSKIILDKCVFESIKLTSMVFMILIGAILFSLVFRGLEGEEFIHKFLIEMPDNKFMTLFIVLLIMFFLGFILDFIEITFIVIPLIGPALFTLGFDPLWLGILIALVLQTSFITPPFGFSLFYLRGVLPKNVKTTEIYKGIIPFLIIQIFLVTVVFIFPDLATALPKILLK